MTKEEASKKEIELIESYKASNNQFGYNKDTLHRSAITKERIRQSMPKKTVMQLTLDGKIINTYCSTREAYRQTGIRNDYISAVCKHNRGQAGGYKWKYADEN